MSRIYFLSKIKDYFKDKDYKLRKNILLLIDEIDLYLHPAWQQKIITTLINELNECFPDNVFQIVFFNAFTNCFIRYAYTKLYFFKEGSYRNNNEKRG